MYMSGLVRASKSGRYGGGSRWRLASSSIKHESLVDTSIDGWRPSADNIVSKAGFSGPSRDRFVSRYVECCGVQQGVLYWTLMRSQPPVEPACPIYAPCNLSCSAGEASARPPYAALGMANDRSRMCVTTCIPFSQIETLGIGHVRFHVSFDPIFDSQFSLHLESRFIGFSYSSLTFFKRKYAHS